MRMRRPYLFFLARVWVVLIFSAALMSAQQLTGGMQGTVTDSTGSVIAGAEVELTGVDTGITQIQKTGPDGSYRFTSINPGSYRVSIKSTGFETATHRLDIELNKIMRLDVKMQVGQVSTKVEVAATAELVDTTSTNVATNVGTKVINDLPLVTRDITQLVEMMPGTRQAEGTTAGGSQVIDISGNYAQGNGTRRSQSVFYVDGSENMGGWRNQAMQLPNPDAVSEVQVSTSSASAEFGKQPGVSMNAITKSGTNAIHGTAGTSFHWAQLNANNWTTNLAGAPRPADKQKWATGTLGGPIIKNRTFYFLSYQWFNDRNAGTQSSYRMPTPDMVAGNFCGIAGFTIKAKPTSTGTAIGCQIPDALINPVSKQLAQKFPTISEYSNDPVKGRYFWQYFAPVGNNEGLAKIDHTLTKSQQLSVSFMTTSGAQLVPQNVAGLTNNVPGWGGDPTTSAETNTLTARHTWTKGSNLVFENRFAYARMHSLRSRTENDVNLGSFGAIWPDVNDGLSKTLPTISLSSGPTARGGQISDLNQHNWRIMNTTSWMKGKHFIKFGGEFQNNYYARMLNYDNGKLTFDGRFSSNSGPLNGPWSSTSSPSGDNKFAYAWADFLLGQVYSFNATGVQDAAYTGKAVFFFGQDEWRVFRNLTVTAGLRYELYGTQDSNVMLAGYVAGHQSDQFPTVPLGLAFEGDAGVPKGMRKLDRNNFAPRLGLAWDPFGNGNIVFRAAGGVYYAYAPLSIVEQLGSVLNAPTITGNYANISDVWGTANSTSSLTTCQFPNCAMPNFSRDPLSRTWVPMDIIGFDPNIATPYQIQFNTSVDARVTKGLNVQVGYIGNRARKGWAVMDNNLPVWAAGANTGNINSRRPNQLWRSINLIGSNLNEQYDSAQIVVNYQRSWIFNRFTYSVQQWLTSADGQNREVGIDNDSSTWVSNPRNVAGEMASVVPRQQFRMHTVVKVPSVGQAFVKKMTSGWQVSSMLSWNDGDRLNVVTGTDNNYDGVSGDRPDMLIPIVYSGENNNGTITWFQPWSFVAPPTPTADNPYPFGSTPHFAVRGPHQFFMNASIGKTTQINERFKFQLRVDFSNILNHANLDDPNMNFGNSDFGQIKTKTGSGRTAQVQAKFYF